MKKTHTSIRLNEIMNEKNLKQADVLRMSEPYQKKYNVKMRKNDISQYVSGKVEPGQQKLFILSQTLGVSIEWLMGLDVKREITSEEKETEKKNDILSDIILQATVDNELLELIQLLSQVPLEQREAVKSILSALIKTK